MNNPFDNEEAIEGIDQMISMTPFIFQDNESDEHYKLPNDLPKVLPIFPIKENVQFPHTTIPIVVTSDGSMKLLNNLSKSDNKHVLIVGQTNNSPNPSPDDILKVGIIGEIVRVMELEDDTNSIVVLGKKKILLENVRDKKPYMEAQYKIVKEVSPDDGDMEFQALIDSIREVVAKILFLRRDLPKPIIKSITTIDNPKTMLNFACANFSSSLEEKVSLLLMNDIKVRAFSLLNNLNSVLQLLEMKVNIQMRTKSNMDQQQKEYFLQQQMRVIREELQSGSNNASDEDKDVLELQKKLNKIKWPSKKIKALVEKEIKKLERLNIQSPDYSIQLQYLQTIMDIPWDKTTKDNFNIKNASNVLDRDHFGLEKVKERILEHLAVLKLKGDLRAPIICLYGPPGVGKTSLGKSIADALNRKYIRISLGGLHDEAEIRGHRRTYIGAMPGRIIKGLIRAESQNPVFVLDEIDKLANDYKGDPSSALLEVLDPEQNNTFHDNYLDINFDLSKVLFIATANNISSIPDPLKDRMELIYVPGYIIEEKLEIAKRHLLPKALKNHGLTDKQVKIPKKSMQTLIESYTRESGVRMLEKVISSLLRKVAKKVAESIDEDKKEDIKFTISEADIKEMLGAPTYNREIYEGNKYAGVVTGLAWTSVGGEILTVESALSPSKQGKMTITGNLGSVMKESAILALKYVESHCEQYKINKKIFEDWNVHIHVPEGAIPKDGPSAGITLATSLISTFTQCKVKANIAMTGEITLRGKVLPVGGIKEKILAAKRSQIKKIILSNENKKDIDEIKDIYVKGLEFIYVNDVSEVIAEALTKIKVENAIKL